jgi:UDPglucose 6-dehydrogenase
MKIGICGCGFVGNAIKSYFENIGKETIVYDKYKKINSFEKLFPANIIFICLPTNLGTLENDKTYNMKEIDDSLELFNNYLYSGLLIIKSTVLPSYCQEINNKYTNLKIISNPEFLSARTATEDFSNQKHIILGYTKQSFELINIVYNFYKELFPQATISITTAEESSLVKLGCNSFYAMKIQFFTELYLLCKKMNLNFDNVKDLMIKNDWINPMHTFVPGHDGKISYGGACLPKDIQALSNFMEKQNTTNLVLDAVIKDNKKTREKNIEENVEENIEENIEEKREI